MKAGVSVRKKAGRKFKQKAKATKVVGVSKRIALATPKQWQKR